MQQQDSDILRILAVSCEFSGESEQIQLTRSSTIAQTLAELRKAHFHLLMTPRLVQGVPVWKLMQTVRRLRPKLRWWLICDELNEQDEIQARALRVTRIFTGVPAVQQLHESLPRVPLSPRDANGPPLVTAIEL